MSFQLSIKFEGHNSLKKTAMPLASSKSKWAWQAHFLSHTYETQEICCFLADVKIILLSFFDLSYCLKVAKNAGAFLSRCIELLDLTHIRFKEKHFQGNAGENFEFSPESLCLFT